MIETDAQADDRRRGRRRGDAPDRPGRRAGLPDHAADADHPGLREVRRRRAARSAELVNVESEHSAMSAAVGAALAGARTMTATSSQGLALMAEVVYIAAAMRAPIVMAVGNRALSGPINIHCDHSDSMLIRDSGVVQLFAENAQEAYDLMVMAPRIAEHPDVLLPVLVCQDGFTITHSAEPVALLDGRGRHELRRRVRRAVSGARHGRADDAGPVRDARLLLRAAPPAGARARAGLAVFDEVAAEYEPLSGRVTARSRRTARRRGARDRGLGSTAGTVKDVVDELRDEGEPVGLLKIGSFRPFPAERSRRSSRDVELRDRARPRRLARRRRPALRGAGRRPLRQRRRAARARLRARRPRPAPRGRAPDLRRRRRTATSDCEVSHVPPEDTRPQRGRRAAARRTATRSARAAACRSSCGPCWTRSRSRSSS